MKRSFEAGGSREAERRQDELLEKAAKLSVRTHQFIANLHLQLYRHGIEEKQRDEIERAQDEILEAWEEMTRRALGVGPETWGWAMSRALPPHPLSHLIKKPAAPTE